MEIRLPPFIYPFFLVHMMCDYSFENFCCFFYLKHCVSHLWCSKIICFLKCRVMFIEFSSFRNILMKIGIISWIQIMLDRIQFSDQCICLQAFTKHLWMYNCTQGKWIHIDTDRQLLLLRCWQGAEYHVYTQPFYSCCICFSFAESFLCDLLMWLD